jgi:hypothetical protein
MGIFSAMTGIEAPNNGKNHPQTVKQRGCHGIAIFRQSHFIKKLGTSRGFQKGVSLR